MNGTSSPISINGGIGNDSFVVSLQIAAPVTLLGGGGSDLLTVNGSPASETISVTASVVSSATATINYSGLTSLVINGLGGNDTFILSGTGATTTVNGLDGQDIFNVRRIDNPTTLNTGAGINTVNVGSSAPYVLGVTDFINALLTINGNGADTLNIEDAGSTVSKAGALTGTSITGLGMAGSITYYHLAVLNISLGIGGNTFIMAATSLAATTLNSGSGNDTISIQSISGPTTINTGAGVNTINVGSDLPVMVNGLPVLSGGVLTGIQGILTLNGSGSDTLNVDSTGSSANLTGFLTSGTLTGLGMTLNPPAMTYQVQFSTDKMTWSVLDVVSGSGASLSWIDPNVQVQGAFYRVVELTPGSADLLIGATSTLVSGHIRLSWTNNIIAGAAPVLSSGGISYNGLRWLNVSLGTGNDTFNVLSTSAATRLNTGGGLNTTNVGSLAPGVGGIVDNIQGALTVVGNGADTLNVDDTGSTTNKSGTLTDTTLTGLGMGSGGITYSGAGVLNVSLGSGNDSFAINEVSNPTVTTIDGGPGCNVATLTFQHDFAAKELTLLKFATATMTVGGDFTGLLNDPGAMPQISIAGSFASSGVLNAGSIGVMTVGGDLAGLLNVTRLLDKLSIGGGAPGKIVAGSINLITVSSGYGNKVFQVIEGGVERQIQAIPLAGGAISNAVRFAFVYDSTCAGDPQLAIRVENSSEPIVRFDLVLVTRSVAAGFNLALLFADGHSGISNVSVEGSIVTSVSQAALTFFGSSAPSRSGVVLPADSITGVEVRDTLPMGQIDVAGLQGIAFAILLSAAGKPVVIPGDTGAGTLWKILGSHPTLVPVTDVFRVPFGENHSVKLYANTDTDQDFDLAMTLTDQLANNASVTALVKMQAVPARTETTIIQSLQLFGDGGSVSTKGSLYNLTSTGALGDVIVNGPAGIGNITAPSIFGSIRANDGGITGTIQTTGIEIDPITGEQTQVSADIGRLLVNQAGKTTGVTTIFSRLSMTGSIICRGNLISSVTANRGFSGVIAVQGDVGAILRDASGRIVSDTAGRLTRYGGITVSGVASGQIIALGNIFGALTVKGAFQGRIAVAGQTVAGLDAGRFGILGSVSLNSMSAGSVVVSGGLIGDAAGKTAFWTSAAKGLLAAKGAVNLAHGVKVPLSNLFQNTGAAGNLNGPVIDAVFTNNSRRLALDNAPGDLRGLALLEQDLLALHVVNGSLTGPIP